MTIPKTLSRWSDRIDEVEDYRYTGEGLWVHLKSGWINTLTETHSINEETVGECLKVMRDFVTRCTGVCCQSSDSISIKTKETK